MVGSAAGSVVVVVTRKKTAAAHRRRRCQVMDDRPWSSHVERCLLSMCWCRRWRWAESEPQESPKVAAAVVVQLERDVEETMMMEYPLAAVCPRQDLVVECRLPMQPERRQQQRRVSRRTRKKKEVDWRGRVAVAAAEEAEENSVLRLGRRLLHGVRRLLVEGGCTAQYCCCCCCYSVETC